MITITFKIIIIIIKRGWMASEIKFTEYLTHLCMSNASTKGKIALVNAMFSATTKTKIKNINNNFFFD